MSAIETQVRQIISRIRREGDRALIAATRRWDRWPARASSLEVTHQEIHAAWRNLDAATKRALNLAAKRIRAFHARQLEKGWERHQSGVTVGMRITPLEKVGVYVPGGRATYPSTVLMNAIPARIAGVGEIIMVTPATGGRIAPVVLAAAKIAGVNRIFKVGGAQAIAALAYGTRTIPQVDKIVGPGNIFVATAKKMVFGVVDIDMIAGPTEVLIIADNSANPEWIAADLISQAEHDPDAIPQLLTNSASLLTRVRKELRLQVANTQRRAIVRRALTANGVIKKVRNLIEACDLANRIAPEHLELVVKNPRRWLKNIRNAGAIFLGPYSPVALGDYIAGPNHVLPTGGTARFASPLGVYDFIKRSSVIEASRAGLKRLAPAAEKLATVEGLWGHCRSLRIRYLDNE